MEDLPALIAHLGARRGLSYEVSADAFEALARYQWPQNVRELDHALRRAEALANGRLELDHFSHTIQASFRSAAPSRLEAMPALDLVSRDLEAALRQHRGNIRKVSQVLGIPRGRLYRLIAKWSIDPAAFRTPSDGLTAMEDDLA